MESTTTAPRNVSEFEQLYLKRIRRIRQFEVNLLKTLSYLFLLAVLLIPILKAMSGDLQWVIALSFTLLLAVVLKFLLSWINHGLDVKTIFDRDVQHLSGTLRHQTEITSLPSGSQQNIEHFYIDNRWLITPPESDDLLHRYIGKPLHASVVRCRDIKHFQQTGERVKRQQWLLLSLSGKEPIIDIHQLYQHHGRWVFVALYISLLPMFAIMAVVFGGIFYWLIQSKLLLTLGFGWVLLLLLAVAIVGVGCVFLLFQGYELLRKKWQPQYQSPLLSYEEKLRGKH